MYKHLTSLCLILSIQFFSQFTYAVDQCLEANLDRYLWVSSQAPYNPDLFNANEKYDLALKRYQSSSNKNDFVKLITGGAWAAAGLIPVLEAQTDAVDLSIKYLGSRKIQSRQDAIDFLSGKFYNPEVPYMGIALTEISAENRTKITKPKIDLILNLPQDKNFSSMIKDTAAITALCGQISIIDVFSCTKAVLSVIQESRFSGNNILYPKIWYSAATDAKFRNGLRSLALRLLKLEQNSSNSGNLLKEGIQAFAEVGIPYNLAEEYTWQTMALYGNGGHNTGERLLFYDLNPEEQSAAVSLTIIGSEISVLDFIHDREGAKSYSFPETISGSCVSPKPYHFWLTAYIARSLVLQKYSPKVSAEAAFIVAKLYQLNRQLNNSSKGVGLVLNKEPRHPTIKVIRMDLTLNAAGAVYGASLGKANLNISDGYEYLWKHSNSYKPLSNSEAAVMAENKVVAASTWDSFFQPNSVFQFFMKDLK